MSECHLHYCIIIHISLACLPITCSDIMLLSNTLFYNHQLKCGNVGVASGRLLLPLPESLPSNSPDWLCQAVDPDKPVIFLNTDKVYMTLHVCMYV